jgi:hypothetical protein
MTPLGIEPTTFWLVAQYLNQLHHPVHANSPLSQICHFHFILVDLMTIITFSKYEIFT